MKPRALFPVAALLASAGVLAECPLSASLPPAEYRAEAGELTPQAAAIECLRAGIKRWRTQEPVHTAEMQLALGKLLEETGDFADAKAELLEASRTFESHNLPARLAEAQRFVGWQEYRLGDLTSAETVLRRALSLSLQHEGPRHLATAKVLNSIGVVLRDRSDYTGAQRLFDDALAITGEQSSRDSQDLAGVIHNNLAGLWYYRSDFRRAIEEFDQARRVFIALYGERNTAVAMAYNNLGTMYQELGAYEEADRWLQRALPLKMELFGPTHATVGSTVANIGLVADSQGRIDVARAQYAKAREIYVKAVGEQHPNVASVENMWGAMELRAGNAIQAREHLEHALLVREQAIGPNSSWIAETLNDLGQAYQALNRPAEARAALQRSISVAVPIGENEVLWEAYAAYARVLAKQDLLEPAAFFGKQAVNVIQEMRAGLAALEQPLQRSFLAQREPAYRELADVLITLGRIPEAQQVLDMLKEEEYLDFVRTRAAVEDFGSTRARFTTRERGFADRLDAAGKELKQAKGDEAQGRARAGVVRLLREISEGSAPNAPLVGAGAEGATATLPAGTTVLRYVVTPDRVRILGANGTKQWQRDARISSTALNRQVFELRQLIQNPRSDPRAAAQALHEILIAPVAADLAAAGTKRLLLIQDGTLRYLPFGVLHDGTQYLIEKHEIIVATPAGHSSTAAAAPAAQDRIAAFGVTKGSAGLAELPRVAVEVERIVRRDERDRDGVLPGIIALDDAFTATRFGDALTAGFAAVHIASHFVFRPGPVDESFLLLGGGSRLTLDQLRSTRYSLRNVQLLTLSACETAVGQPDATGREFESFGVLAQRQGARAVLATLWRVTDLSTATFMARFYRERQNAPDAGSALRQAQLAFLQRASAASAAPIYRHPFYWAPYVIMAPVQ